MKTSLFSLSILGVLFLGSILLFEVAKIEQQKPVPMTPPASHIYFKTGEACMSCHNGLVTSEGEDVSFGITWRASMMANSARDPYWQAAVRREVIDHPEEQEVIEDECATCHMPMSRSQANLLGEKGSVFEHLPIGNSDDARSQLAADGVSCAVCHQIEDSNFGEPTSFSGGYVFALEAEDQVAYGPYQVDNGKSVVMHSATGFRQAQSNHIQQSEMCATCHTLFTKAIGPMGDVVGELPEQVPFLEWQHSAYREEKSCQSCHMPVVKEAVPISSVLGEPRTEVSRHVFRGGNFFMQRMLNRYRAELGVKALPHEMNAAIQQTEKHLQTNTARIEIQAAAVESDTLHASVLIENLAGHKLPTAYPSRRAWIHFKVIDRNKRVIFESGKMHASGLIQGNNNDENASAFEPHHTTIHTSDQVQIYESMMVDVDGNLTTGLLKGYRYIKDNRVLPAGFDKNTAQDAIAVQGHAAADRNFIGGQDVTHFTIGINPNDGPYEISASLWYQPISYRWAENLRQYESIETNRFNNYYDAMSERSGIILASTAINTDNL